MSAAEQLALIREKKPKPEICRRCLHTKEDHNKGRGRCAFATVNGADAVIHSCDCKRFKGKRKPVEQPEDLRPPADAIILMSPDTKTHVDMGWAVLDDGDLVVYIAQLDTQRPNEFTGKLMSILFKREDERTEDEHSLLKRYRRMAMGIRMSCVKIRDRVKSGVIQGKKRLLLIEDWRRRPTHITITRVSFGNIGDDDGVHGALKFARDGVALALELDDSAFSICGKDPTKIALDYEQIDSGKAGVRGVFIEISWRE